MTTAVAKRLDTIKERSGVSAANIAELIGTTPQTLSRWYTGRNEPQRELLDRLLGLDYIIEQLSEFFEAGEIRLWLAAPHPQLGGQRPADVLAHGRYEDVLAVVARLRDSAYV